MLSITHETIFSYQPCLSLSGLTWVKNDQLLRPHRCNLQEKWATKCCNSDRKWSRSSPQGLNFQLSLTKKFKSKLYLPKTRSSEITLTNTRSSLKEEKHLINIMSNLILKSSNWSDYSQIPSIWLKSLLSEIMVSHSIFQLKINHFW